MDFSGGGVTANSSNPLDNFSFDRIFTVTCNTTAGCPSTNVFVQTQATAGLMLDIGQSGSSAANAFADPIITIDPNFVDAALFDIVFSPGLDVVPIPASVYLFGSGLLGLVGMARRKKAA